MTQHNKSGVAPVVLERTGRGFKTPNAMYDTNVELCMRILHMQTVPLHEACNVQQLMGNRSTHALNLPGRYVPSMDGSVPTLTPPEAEGAPASCEAGDSAWGLV